jgi:hypothetical protein
MFDSRPLHNMSCFIYLFINSNSKSELKWERKTLPKIHKLITEYGFRGTTIWMYREYIGETQFSTANDGWFNYCRFKGESRSVVEWKMAKFKGTTKIRLNGDDHCRYNREEKVVEWIKFGSQGTSEVRLVANAKLVRIVPVVQVAD